jgi:uncharacterized lipoprotein YddW (UPF0748 family)
MKTYPLKPIQLFQFLFLAMISLAASCNVEQSQATKITENKETPESLGEAFFPRESTRLVDKTNPPYAPNGGRGANQLIVYTPEYGPNTYTNPWGVEAIVENEVVVKVGGNDSPVPPNGLVVSGHGTAAEWINENIKAGYNIKVGYDTKLQGNALIVTTSENTIVQQARIMISDGEKRAQTITHPSIESEALANLKELFNEKLDEFIRAKQNADSANVQTLAEETLRRAKDFFYYTFPSLTDRERSAWLEIDGMSYNDIEAAFQDLADIGFNAVCPEVIYRGWAIFPNAPNGLNQYPDFIGRDPLQEMIDLGKKYNLKIIPWVWVYFIGVDRFPDLINNRSEWLAVSRKGTFPSETEKGFHYFCPSRPQVQEYWLQIYEYMYAKYDLNDLQLDYIRYPGEPWTNDYCYCDVCRTKFKTLSGGVDPLSINPTDNPELWAQWDQFRQENVSRFVEAVSQLLPDVNLSADVVPDLAYSLESKKQNWGKWLDNNWLKTVYIMSYSSDVDLVASHIDYMADKTTANQLGVAGLGPFAGMQPETLIEEIDLVRIKNIEGSCQFIYNALTDEQKYALKKGPFRLHE